MNHFTVDTTALRHHAAQVRHIAEGVGQAADAATEVGIGGVDIYGVLCSALIVPALHGFFGDAVDLVKKAGEFTSTYAEGLETNSDVYDEVDHSVVETLHTLHSELL